eukprot:gene23694-30729_t
MTLRTENFKCTHPECFGRLNKSVILDAITGQEISDPVFTTFDSSHIISCVADPAHILRRQAQQLVLLQSTARGGGNTTVRESNGLASRLLRNIIGDVAAAQLPNARSMQRTVNRRIHNLNGEPPNTLPALIEIPGQYGVTISNAQFLTVFSPFVPIDGSVGGMIIVYSTRDDLIKLFNSRVFCADGIVRILPIPYHKTRSAQVFTLNTFIGGGANDGTVAVNESVRMYRRVLALLPRRTEECYREFLRLLFDAAVNVHGINLNFPGSIQWRRLMCDFETAIRSSFRHMTSSLLHIDNFEIEGCHMHYCSAIIKKLKSIGLGPLYMNHQSGLMHFVRKLFALAFLPLHLVIVVYNWIKANKVIPAMSAHHLFQAFIAYYESTWIYNLTLPITVWNVFDRSDFSKRTNNNLEGTHRFYLNNFGVHKDLWTFLRKLQDDQDRQQSEENQYVLAGQIPNRMKAKDRLKEMELIRVRQFFIESGQTCADGYIYLVAVALKMRQYNLSATDDDDDGVDHE